MSAKGLSISFNPVKVCSAEHAWHDPYLIYRLQSMHPTHISPHSWLGYGWLSVSRMRLLILGYLAIVFPPANHRFFTHFGEDHCRMSSMHSILESPPRKRSIILTAISKLLFDLPIDHRERLERLWVDQLVYCAPWRKHVSERAGDLLQKITWVSKRYLSACSI